MSQPQEMSPSKCNEHLFAKEQVTCTKTEYHRDIRGVIDLAIVRQKDIGNADLQAFAEGELKRLDKIHGASPE